MINKKIKGKTQIVKIVKDLKANGKKIVTYNGSFDILHIGHIKSLYEAKSKGDILIVLLNSDKSIKIYKGPKRPIINEKDRAGTLSAIECVDYVTIFDEINPINILNLIKPHVHCNGSDWGKDCVERGVVERNGGHIHVLRWQKGYSTTGLISKITELYSTPSIKAVFIDRDGTINDNGLGYIYRIEDFKFLPGSIEALKRLSDTNYKIIIVTNQSGIGRGLYTQSDFEKLNSWFLETCKKHGIRIDKIYFCPHAPEDGCRCRKPEIGMLLDAVNDFGISLNESWVIGDDPKDVIMGRLANTKTIKIGSMMPPKLKLQPNFYATNLLEAVEKILNFSSPSKKMFIHKPPL